MKTQITLTIDKDIKDKFQKIAKKMGANMSTLTNMYYAEVIRTGKVQHTVDNEPVEIGWMSVDKLPTSVKTKYLASKKKSKKEYINI